MAETPLAVSNAGSSLPRTCPVLYIAAFVLVQIAALLGALKIASTPWFLDHDHYPGMRQAGYGLRLQHADCEVLIYGDSSALTGLHPETIQKITGLKTCNVSEGGTIQGVVGSNWPLDGYLKNNKRPRFLLTMYTSSIFQPYRQPLAEYQPEGMLYAFQYDSDAQLYRGLLHRPKWLLNFAIWSGHAVLEDMQARLWPGERQNTNIDTRAQRESQNGVWPYPLPAEDHCTRTAFHYDPASVARHADSVEAMRRMYSIDGTRVLINIAPLPTCDTLQQAYEKQSEGLHDNAFETLPISDFNDSDAHFTPEGGRTISVEAAEQILTLEQHDDASGPARNGEQHR